METVRGISIRKSFHCAYIRTSAMQVSTSPRCSPAAAASTAAVPRRSTTITAVACDATQQSLITRRQQLAAVAAALALAPPAPSLAAVFAPANDDFIASPSGLRYLDIRQGEGATPQPGDTVVVHWSGYTKNYQCKPNTACAAPPRAAAHACTCTLTRVMQPSASATPP